MTLRQQELAVYAARLLPHALSLPEYQLLKAHLSNSQSELYLKIRNLCLLLWHKNPGVPVSITEILGYIKNKNLYSIAQFAFEYLVRNGFINFGCLHVEPLIFSQPPQSAKQKTIIVIGAGVSGLCTARQLHHIFVQFGDRWTKQRREKIPRVIVLEGRQRIGGRVYSKALKAQVAGSLPHGLANTAEMGAQIITGFEHGNPLDAVVRGQLALEYHLMKDNMVLYDYDGSSINIEQDTKIQNLYNDLLEAAGSHGWHAMQAAAMMAKQSEFLNPAIFKQESPATDGNNKLVNGFDIANHTLGTFMDEIIVRSRQQLPLSAQEMRLLHWHYANLEYGNAVNVDQLSLGGWDQDQGNEFEGRHSEIKGGYSQLPRALFKHPTTLDVRLGKAVRDVRYTPNGIGQSPSATIHCEDSEVFQADHIVSTIPLGVLKEQRVAFDPPLPTWKSDAMQRLGFGVLNKVILVFDRVFWDVKRDMFGLLNQSVVKDSLNPQDYASDRGLFYLFWNCVKTSGLPVLIGVLAGDAARSAESMDDQTLVVEATTRLAKMFKLPERPIPTEAVITRWRRDRFARGSYSYMGPTTVPGDYEAMATRVGNLHWAGEHTCGTHPATVHGAYLSGLRAASEVVEAMIGPVPPPSVVGV